MRPRKTNGRLMDGVFALNEFVTNSGTPVMRPVFRRVFLPARNALQAKACRSHWRRLPARPAPRVGSPRGNIAPDADQFLSRA